MKAIMTDDKILSLEKIKTIEMLKSNYGSQKNPDWRYFLNIKYMNDNTASSPSIPEKEKVTKWFDEAFKIITSD